MRGKFQPPEATTLNFVCFVIIIFVKNKLKILKVN